ncbi:restriction endonuclease [Mycoplasmopsis felis]|uniref:HinfI family type II restriction enzyme n=1 Tax=Mycoplasmopsis felis TaxID=33923 RepID=UPI002AFEA761|nr:restriction endonuclease [Mycoplasmopsis felis]WQQ06559.1 restriction endonuclease [Mycoplasmopsis felis]
MINKDIKRLISEAVKEIINKSLLKVNYLSQKHNNKIHFIPKRYRILGGILQSMNIQFGNFIEILIQNLIKENPRYEIISKYSRKRYNNFLISQANEKQIDEYITRCQQDLNIDLDREYHNLLTSLKTNINKGKFIKSSHDIDLLFKDKKENKIYYVEIKYNDDHDTGKFIDINRKFLKTYCYLLNEELGVNTEIIPILFYFNNKIMKGNIYLPEKEVIYRGKRFFEQFLTIDYKELDNYLLKLSENQETINMFNNMYNNILKNN